MHKTNLKNYEEVKDKITMKLINANTHAEMLMDHPHERVEDLAILYQLHALEESTNRTFFIHVDHELMNHWNIEPKDLFQTAKENTLRFFPPVLEDMEELLGEFFDREATQPANLLEADPEMEMTGSMYVLMNGEKLHGAIAIAFPEVLEQIQERLPQGYFILPSSVHECIIVPKSEEVDPRKLGEMVRDVNASQVAPEEVLSDRVYEFSKEHRGLKQIEASVLKAREISR